MRGGAAQEKESTEKKAGVVPSPKAAFGDWALVAWVSLAVRTDARLWAQGGTTVVGLERVRPPLGLARSSEGAFVDRGTSAL